MRRPSCAPPISIEKTRTGSFTSRPTYSAMLSARLVLPIAGRPATMTSSPGCRPEVISSKSTKPVATPVTEAGFL